MHRRVLVAAALAAIGLPLWGQQQPPDEEKKLTFRFKDASVEAVCQYVSSVTGWIFVHEKRVTGTIDATSDTDVPLSKVLDFLDGALRRHGATLLNPYSPRMPRGGEVVKIVDVDVGKRLNLDIYVGADPEQIPIIDKMRTQIVPLKAVNVVEVSKELGDVLRNAMGEGGQVGVTTYSNSMVLIGRSDGINRAVRILRVIDVSASAELKIRVYTLRNADATETAKVLNDVFRKEAMQGSTGRSSSGGGFDMMRLLTGGGDSGGGRSDKGGDRGAGPTARALAHEMVRITAEPRTNSVIVTATEDNMKLITELVARLDDKGAGAVRLKLYPLRYADATTAAKLINEVFAETPTNSRGSSGDRNRSQVPVWMGGAPSSPTDPLGATKEVRAVADVRTNSVLVAAGEQKLAIIDDLVREIDRQVNDMLVVKIYDLKNADAVQMTTVLQALFRPQVQATQNTGRGGGGTSQNQGGSWIQQQLGFGGGGSRGGSSGGSSQLLPSQEIEITNDPRTNSLIVKASKEYIGIIDDVVKQLDANPTETKTTISVPIINHTAVDLATALQNLVRGQTTGTTSSQFGTRTGQTQTQPGMFGNQNQGFGNRGSAPQSGSTRGSAGGTSRTRSGQLGPLEQDPPGLPPQQEEEPQRRSIEGTVDIQPDAATNRMLLRGAPRDLRAIQALIDELDRVRPQVLIKVLIADVTLDESTQFGVEGLWENRMRVRGGDPGLNRFATDFALGTSGFTYLLSGDEFQASLNFFAREGRLKVLATPRILALDNATASINVGKEVPRVSNTQVNQLGNTVNTVIYENVGILLQVTPHINPNGLVTMDINPEISDVASAAESVPITEGVNSPTFNVNAATTTVAVRTGTTIVIGGLIRETVDDSVDKVPVLGDLPIIGPLFSNTSKRKVKRELMIFLTPYVAFTASQLEEITELEKSRLKIMDLRDIEAESDRWLERVRK